MTKVVLWPNFKCYTVVGQILTANSGKPAQAAPGKLWQNT